MMTAKTKWVLRHKKIEINDINKKKMINQMKNHFELSALSAEILINRGYLTKESITKFLDPKADDLYDPFLFNDMEKAVLRILRAKNKEKICIYGDYDADGTTGVAILFDFLKNMDFDVSFYIPNRLKTGYGLHQTPLEEIIKQGVSLIITVDNGISATEQISMCNRHHVDVIVTDHHECHGKLPEAFAIINPKIPGSTYPFKELCGAGVVFKLIQALCQKIRIEFDFQESIECVALATVADLVPLYDENRCLVSMGLKYLNKDPRNPGIKALMKASDLNSLKAWHFGFVLGPKINAAGRLGEANQVVELLTGSEPEKLLGIAQFLNDENKKRQDLEACILEEALQQIEKNELNKEDIIVVVGEEWHSGVIGIVASRIQEIYYKPVIVITLENGVGKGSCRSIEGFNIFEALQFTKESFTSFGGHEQAAGFSINAGEISKMTSNLLMHSNSVKIKEILIKKIYFDAVVNETEMTWDFYYELMQFEPCGLGNPAVQFVVDKPKIKSIGTMGKKNDHLRVSFADDLRGVGFSLGYFLSQNPNLHNSGYQELQLLCRLDVNDYLGNKSLQLMVKAIRQNPIWEVESAKAIVRTISIEADPLKVLKFEWIDQDLTKLQLELDTIRKVFGLIKRQGQTGVPLQNGSGINNLPSPYHLLMACEVLREAGLIAYGIKNQIIFGKIIGLQEKKDIQNTKLMIKLEKIIRK
jgi:single-stranded-DNA-specific exonuclease